MNDRGTIGPRLRAGRAKFSIQVGHHVIRQATTHIISVRGRHRVGPALAARQQRLLTHNRSGDDRAPHPVSIFQVDRSCRTNLRTGAAADAHLRGACEVKVGEPAGRRVAHPQCLDTHLAADGHAQTATDADVAA